MNNFYPYPQMMRQEITRVNGENGARAFQLAPNSSVLLLDENSPIVWVVQSDGAGYKTVTPYTSTPYKPEPEVDLKSLEDRIKRLEESVNVKPNTGNAKRTKDSE